MHDGAQNAQPNNKTSWIITLRQIRCQTRAHKLQYLAHPAILSLPERQLMHEGSVHLLLFLAST